MVSNKTQTVMQGLPILTAFLIANTCILIPYSTLHKITEAINNAELNP